MRYLSYFLLVISIRNAVHAAQCGEQILRELIVQHRTSELRSVFSTFVALGESRQLGSLGSGEYAKLAVNQQNFEAYRLLLDNGESVVLPNAVSENSEFGKTLSNFFRQSPGLAEHRDSENRNSLWSLVMAEQASTIFWLLHNKYANPFIRRHSYANTKSLVDLAADRMLFFDSSPEMLELLLAFGVRPSQAYVKSLLSRSLHQRYRTETENRKIKNLLEQLVPLAE